MNIPTIFDQHFHKSQVTFACGNAKCFGLKAWISPIGKQQGGHVFVIARYRACQWAVSVTVSVIHICTGANQHLSHIWTSMKCSDV